jgi:hypothetical protein
LPSQRSVQYGSTRYFWFTIKLNVSYDHPASLAQPGRYSGRHRAAGASGLSDNTILFANTSDLDFIGTTYASLSGDGWRNSLSLTLYAAGREGNDP